LEGKTQLVERYGRPWPWLLAIGLAYGVAFALPAAEVSGAAERQPDSRLVLDGRGCFSWGLQTEARSWYANPVLWAGCYLLAWRLWAAAGVTGLLAGGLGLADAVPCLLGWQPADRIADPLPGFWVWIGSMVVLTAAGFSAHRAVSIPAQPEREAEPINVRLLLV
jgi:hypothetical protein